MKGNRESKVGMTRAPGLPNVPRNGLPFVESLFRERF
jgi:hypothetical protein